MNGGEIKTMSKKFFVGGPISNLKEVNELEDFIKIHSFIINELSRQGFQVFSAHIVEKYGRNKIEPDDVIVNRDLGWIDEADVCIFLFPAYDCQSIRTDGTYIELGYATSKCNHIICFWDSNNPIAYSPMFRGMTNKNIEMHNFDEIREVLIRFEL